MQVTETEHIKRAEKLNRVSSGKASFKGMMETDALLKNRGEMINYNNFKKYWV